MIINVTNEITRYVLLSPSFSTQYRYIWQWPLVYMHTQLSCFLWRFTMSVVLHLWIPLA